MFFKKSILSNQNGQALLIIVLVMVVALTVGLSVATRTIINLRNTTDQASSQKALSAAEAGVEESIKSGSSISSANFYSGSDVSAHYSTSVNPVLANNKFLLNGGKEISESDAIYVWVAPYSTNPAVSFTQTWSGNFYVYWGESSGNCNQFDSANPSAYNPKSAVEVAVLYGSKAAPFIKRFVFDPCPARASINHFNNASVVTQDNNICTGANCSTTKYYAQMDLSALPVLLIRVNPVYNTTHLGAWGTPSLAGQGTIIQSTGTTDQNTRKISVYEGYPEIPAEFFPNVFRQ